jgi:hypothetical protein
VALSRLSEKNRQTLLQAGAEEYLEKNSLRPSPGINMLPNALENVICRINRKRGIAFSSIPFKPLKALQSMVQVIFRGEIGAGQQQQA